MTEMHNALENAAAAVVSTSDTAVGSKRQRRPSVRLGDIGGDPPYDSYSHRTIRTKTQNPSPQFTNKPTKIKPLTNLAETLEDSYDSYSHRTIRTKTQNPSPQFTNIPSKIKPLTNLAETLEDDSINAVNNNHVNSNVDTVVGRWSVKDNNKKRDPAKRVRSNWVVSSAAAEGEDDIENEGYERDFDMKKSESPLSKEQSPLHPLENLADGANERERELGYHRNNFSTRSMSNNNDGGGEDGVTIWLQSLGLGRYAPVFEIHEVDDEVLPMLTLEDLKDMGINAVGSRRKMFYAIQKLSKGFS